MRFVNRVYVLKRVCSYPLSYCAQVILDQYNEGLVPHQVRLVNGAQIISAPVPSAVGHRGLLGGQCMSLYIVAHGHYKVRIRYRTQCCNWPTTQFVCYCQFINNVLLFNITYVPYLEPTQV